MESRLPRGRGRELGAGPRYLYWVVGDLAASNIFLRPSMPDMASTFFLQSPTSTGRSCAGHTRETERQPARRDKDWAMGSQPALEGGAAPALLPPEQGGEPRVPSPQSPRGSGMVCQGAGLPRDYRASRVGCEWGLTFSVSSFFTDLRLARRSIDTLCLEPSRARSMASAETRTRRSGGRLNFPRKSSTLSFRSLICGEQVAQDSGPGPQGRP